MFFKSLPEKLISHGLQYEIGKVVTDPKPFRPDIDCDYGIHYTDMNHILDWLTCLEHDVIGVVQLPQDAQTTKGSVSIDQRRRYCI